MERVLPIVIYILIIVLLLILIVLGIKFILTMFKVDRVVDNVNEKIETLNPIFGLIDYTTDRVVGFSEKLIDLGSVIINKLISIVRRKGDEDE